MIAILLATFNSERFLCEQIDSIFSQTYTEWKLFIRDDGSSDHTIEIIKRYQVKSPQKIILLSNNNKSLKAYGNFVELMNRVDYDYYMFCDHDDVWLPDKIRICYDRIKKIEEVNMNKPIVVHTDMKVVNQNLEVISDSFWKYSRLLPGHVSFWELVCCNAVNGCTMLFNKQAKMACLGNEPYCLMHDTLVSQSVAAVGGIISAINEPTVLYRQHTDNVIGASNIPKLYFINRIKSIFPTLKRNIDVWKRACHMKKISLLSYYLLKTKVSVIRFLRYS